MNKKDPPSELVTLAASINKDWLTHRFLRIEPYLHSCEWEDRWLFRMIDEKQEKTEGKDVEYLVENLDPACACGHTYMLFAEAIAEQRRKAELSGMRKAIVNLAFKCGDVLNIKPQELVKDMAKRLT